MGENIANLSASGRFMDRNRRTIHAANLASDGIVTSPKIPKIALIEKLKGLRLNKKNTCAAWRCVKDA